MESNNIDYTKFDSIGPKKIKATTNVALANYATAVNALYNYSEETLERVDDKLVQIEAILDLLECKLSSIPGDAIPDGQQSTVVPSQVAESTYVAAPENPNPEVPKLPPPAEEPAKEEAKVDPEQEKEKMRAELYQDEQVKTFAKMLKFGVPDSAITNKMVAMGYDPSLLEVNVVEYNPGNRKS